MSSGRALRWAALAQAAATGGKEGGGAQQADRQLRHGLTQVRPLLGLSETQGVEMVGPKGMQEGAASSQKLHT